MGSTPAALLLALALCGCALPNLPGEPLPAPPPAVVPHQYPRVAADLLAEVNRARATASLQPLSAMRELDSAAEQYARELAQRGVLDHHSPTPGLQTMAQRIQAAGVQFSAAAENLFSHEGTMTDQLARRAVSGWLGSPGHRTNLMNAAYTHSGIGVARGESGVWYVVQLYVTPRQPRT